MIPKLKDMTYEERLKAWDLLNFTHKTIRGDIIEAYKYTYKEYFVEYYPLTLDDDTN